MSDTTLRAVLPPRIDPQLDLVLERVVDVPRELVWTNALAPGLRPAGAPTADMPECEHFAFTCVLTLAPAGAGTRYHALVMHASEASRKQHEQMGFHDGWGKALDQLVAAAGTF